MLYPMNDEERIAYACASSYEEAAHVAIMYLRRVKKLAGRPLVQVCGPISTGGLGDRTRNVQRLSLAIHACAYRKLPVFNQLMFEDMVARFSPDHHPDAYDWRILEKFYLSVLYSYLIDTLYFLPDWQTSKGARWERAMGEELRLNMQDYSPAWNEGGRIMQRVMRARS